ncbi:MAG: Gfo/Idh/MocA family oxidoreductase [Thermoguttaceae bacterium]|jgi:predicted dehydrogenase
MKIVRTSTRRAFLGSAGLAAGLTVIPWRPVWAQNKSAATSYAANEKLNIAGIGVGGRGAAHVQTSLRENLVAICDVVEGTLEGCRRQIEKEQPGRPLPKIFFDYRKLLEEMPAGIDAVFVATPDHQHAPASMMAMKLGKHVYCEKPLTHNIAEARAMTLAARQHKLATQMGNQARASDGWRVLCEMVWAGMIGNVSDLHVWTDRPGIAKRFWWPQGGPRPAGADPVPKGLHWDLWLGSAPERPYLDTYREGKFQGKRVYQPFVWRGWWDFGTGALGDIGCHAMSGPFSALKIEHAAAVELLKDSQDTTSEMFPSASIVRWEIPARGAMPACKIFWYDGGLYPPREVGELAAAKQYPDNGSILVGDRGKISFYDYKPRLIPAEKMKGFQLPPPLIARCASDHFGEWVTACKGGRPPASNFDHAGPLAELVLLGNLAIRAGAGKRVEWDGPNMKCTNLPELNQHVGREYRI